MGFYQHPRMRELEQKQSQEAAELYAEFLRMHPELDGYTNHNDWTPEQDAEYRILTKELRERHRAERRELVLELGGKLSPLSQFQLAHH
jgi:hypothetical protein